MIVFLIALLAIVIGDGTSLKSPLLYVVGGMLILFSLSTISRNGGKLYFGAELLLLVLFTAYTGLTILWAWNPGYTIYRFKIMLFLTGLVILLTNQFYTLGGYKYVLKAYVACAMIMVVVSVLVMGLPQIIHLMSIGSGSMATRSPVSAVRPERS